MWYSISSFIQAVTARPVICHNPRFRLLIGDLRSHSCQPQPSIPLRLLLSGFENEQMVVSHISCCSFYISVNVAHSGDPPFLWLGGKSSSVPIQQCIYLVMCVIILNKHLSGQTGRAQRWHERDRKFDSYKNCNCCFLAWFSALIG